MTNLSKIRFGSVFLFVILGLAATGCPPDKEEQTGSHGDGAAGADGKADDPSQQAPQKDAGSTPACGTRGGVICDKGEFCNHEPDADCGATDRGGQCQETPSVCTKEFRPVCGCDGETYGNRCDAHSHGVSVRYTGACETNDGGTARACGTRGGVVCAEGEFCNYSLGAQCGATDGGGLCEALPQVCTEEYAPVCGCDSRTYGNTCDANSHGMSVLHDGACTESDCIAIGGHAVDGIGPGPMCPRGEANHGYIIYDNGAMSIEGTACCVPNPQMWFETCDGPVCREYDGSLPLCTWQVEGELCPAGADECATGECNIHLRCTDSDPTVNGCPRSRASYKENIEYLDDAELDRYHGEVMSLKLAHYDYKADPAHEPHLGFIIDDLGPVTYVDETKDRVDLYAYTSAVIAAVKVQEKHIQALERQVKTLSRELAKARAQR